MPAVVALSDSFVASLPKGWDATVRIKQANGTTDATVYKDANGDATGANPLPLASAEFGRNYDGNGGWQCYLVPGDYVVSVTPHGGSEHHASVTVTAAAPPVSRGLYEVYGTPSVDVPVPTWNPTTGRLEFAAGGGGGGASEPLGWIAIRYGDMITLTGGGGTMMATVPFDAPDDIGGTGISWDAGAPDQIALEAGHWYGASLTIFHVEQPSDYATAEFETAIQLWPADDLVETYGNFNPVDLRNHSHGDPAVNVEWPMFRVDQDGSFLRVHLKTRGITGTPQAYSPEFTVWRVS